MEVEMPTSIETLLSKAPHQPKYTRLWCDEASSGQSPYLLSWLLSHPIEPDWNFQVLIGPEGGWSSNERELLRRDAELTSSQRIDLGPQILRAETAALFAVSLVTSFCLNQSKSNSGISAESP
jgi:16S rRNA U1498 N3-methylase RsmE